MLWRVGLNETSFLWQAETPIDKFTATLALKAGRPLQEGSEELISLAEKATRRLLNSNVQFCEIPKSEKKAVELLQASVAGNPGYTDV